MKSVSLARAETSKPSTKQRLVEYRAFADRRAEPDPCSPVPCCLADPEGQRADRGAPAEVPRHAVKRPIRHGDDTIVHMTSLQTEPAVEGLIQYWHDVRYAPENVSLEGPVAARAHLARSVAGEA